MVYGFKQKSGANFGGQVRRDRGGWHGACVMGGGNAYYLGQFKICSKNRKTKKVFLIAPKSLQYVPWAFKHRFNLRVVFC